MEYVNLLKDRRSGCVSVLSVMSLKEYYDIAKKSFDNNGNIEGQRGIIKKSVAASRIRKRMEDDFLSGAIFPQVVLGILVKDINVYNTVEDITKYGLDFNTLSIIDGMQRSNIYFSNYENNEEREIRAEFWISDDSVKLLYRMLVLNTGQTPWNTRRQIEVIYGNLALKIEESLYAKYPELKDKIDILSVDERRNRTQAGIYHKSAVIEMYLGFNTRNLKVQVSDELSEEYQRFDVLESIDEPDSLDYFVTALGMMCRLDFAFSTYKKDEMDLTLEGQFSEGKDIFASSPACMGFIVASAEYMLGKKSVNRNPEMISEKCKQYNEQMDSIIQRINDVRYTRPDFLGLITLNEISSNLPKTKIGDEMRRLFRDAFLGMMKNEEFNEVDSMDDFWRE